MEGCIPSHAECPLPSPCTSCHTVGMATDDASPCKEDLRLAYRWVDRANSTSSRGTFPNLAHTWVQPMPRVAL
eukprot:scaffold116_cov334-Pavlova_lutheri.AAC.25